MPRVNKQLHDLKSLRAYHRELQREERRLALEIEAIEEDGIEVLETSNNTIGVRGLGYVAKWIDALREAHLDYRHASGAYSAEPKTRKRSTGRK